jgi:hypothetical protein
MIDLKALWEEEESKRKQNFAANPRLQNPSVPKYQTGGPVPSYMLPEVAVSPQRGYPHYSSLSQEEKKYFQQDNPIGTAVRNKAEKGRNINADDVKDFVMSFPTLAMEASEFPSALTASAAALVAGKDPGNPLPGFHKQKLVSDIVGMKKNPDSYVDDVVNFGIDAIGFPSFAGLEARGMKSLKDMVGRKADFAESVYRSRVHDMQRAAEQFPTEVMSRSEMRHAGEVRRVNSILEDPKSSAEEKLKAIVDSKLDDSTLTKLTGTDRVGTKQAYQQSLVPGEPPMPHNGSIDLRRREFDMYLDSPEARAAQDALDYELELETAEMLQAQGEDLRRAGFPDNIDLPPLESTEDIIQEEVRRLGDAFDASVLSMDEFEREVNAVYGRYGMVNPYIGSGSTMNPWDETAGRTISSQIRTKGDAVQSNIENNLRRIDDKFGGKLDRFIEKYSSKAADLLNPELKSSTENIVLTPSNASVKEGVAQSLLPAMYANTGVIPLKEMLKAREAYAQAAPGIYRASSSLSADSAPMYYSVTSEIKSRVPGTEFVVAGHSRMNPSGSLSKTHTQEQIRDYMNTKLSTLDFDGKKLPKAYINEYRDVMIPNLLLEKKYRYGGKPYLP